MSRPASHRRRRNGAAPVGGRPKVLRNRTNHFSGLVVSFGLLTAVLWGDAYGVARDRPPVTGLLEDGWPLPVLAVISLGSYMLFARPRVELRREVLVLRNVVRDVRIPFSRIEEVDPDSGVYLRVRADGRAYVAAGLEKHKFQLVQGETGVAGQVSTEIDELRNQSPGGGSAPPQVEVWFRRPEPAELVLVVGWTSYTAAVVWKVLA